MSWVGRVQLCGHMCCRLFSDPPQPTGVSNWIAALSFSGSTDLNPAPLSLLYNIHTEAWAASRAPPKVRAGGGGGGGGVAVTCSYGTISAIPRCEAAQNGQAALWGATSSSLDRVGVALACLGWNLFFLTVTTFIVRRRRIRWTLFLRLGQAVSVTSTTLAKEGLVHFISTEVRGRKSS